MQNPSIQSGTENGVTESGVTENGVTENGVTLSDSDELALQGAMLLPCSEQRQSYLEAVCKGDQARFDRLLSLLDLESAAAEFFEPIERDSKPDVGSQLAEVSNNRQIAGYRILKRLGSGGMGTVYQAEHSDNQRQFALKIPRHDVVANIDARKRLLREAHTAAKLQHSGLAQVLDVGNVGPTVFIATELYRHGDLSQWLAQHPPARLAVVCDFLSDLCDAVAYMHSCQVVHLDLKPSNIMLRQRESKVGIASSSKSETLETGLRLEQFTPVVTDFGISQILDECITKTSTSILIGTPLYMAPEQFLPSIGCIGPASDIFAIGTILSELLGITSLREGKSYAEILMQFERNEFDQLPSGIHAYPDELQTILSRCLATAPEHRYESAEQLAADLRACAAGHAIAAKPVSWLDRAKHWCGDRKREQEAWWIVITINTIVIFWMMVGICLIGGANFPGASRQQALIASLGLLLVNTIPMIGLAVVGLRGKSWSLTPALLLVLLGVVLTSSLVLIGVIDAVPGLYENSPFFKSLNHALVFAFGSVQALALLVAKLGRQQRRKRRKRSQAPTKLISA